MTHLIFISFIMIIRHCVYLYLPLCESSLSNVYYSKIQHHINAQK